MNIMQREVPEQVVLTEQRNVRWSEIADWLGGAMGRLERTAASYGGKTAPLFVVYHGQPGDGDDVPIEVCVPIAPDGPVDAQSRVEPAHREAYVRVQKSQSVVPEIRSAYIAVEQWIRSQGLEVTAAPREVYFTDWLSAAPTDEVCDVAFPVG